MGLQATVQKAAQAAIKAAGDIALLCTYRDVTANPSMDVSTGEVTETKTDYASIRTVFADYTKKERENNESILDEDKKALIAKLDLIPVPDTRDKIIDTDSTVWNILNINTDPAKALWILHVRKSKA